jgi:hypothetical protein
MHEVRAGGLETRAPEQLKTDGFEETLFTAMPEVALLDDGGEVQDSPGFRVGFAVFVAGEEALGAVEIEFPHVLAHGVTPHAAAAR